MLGYIKKHVFCFQLLSILEKQRGKNLTADQTFRFRETFNNIWSDTCQYLQGVKVLLGPGKHWKIWLVYSTFIFFVHLKVASYF